MHLHAALATLRYAFLRLQPTEHCNVRFDSLRNELLLRLVQGHYLVDLLMHEGLHLRYFIIPGVFLWYHIRYDHSWLLRLLLTVMVEDLVDRRDKLLSLVVGCWTYPLSVLHLDVLETGRSLLRDGHRDGTFRKLPWSDGCVAVF